MKLFDSIYKRKSCRKYKMEALSKQKLEEINDIIKTFDFILPNHSIKHRFETEIKGKFLVEAPHYLIISGKGEPNELENIGFLYEQLILWFSENNIGSVWLGSAKGLESNSEDIIGIAFGYSPEEIYRNEKEFKRKKIEEITNDIDNPCIKAVHYAPSGMNLQPWYFEKQGNKILVYKQKLKLPISKLYKLTDLDMGIALLHYKLACTHFDKTFSFVRKTDDKSKKGYELFGEITES
ncbi:MAG: nitroreductase family protein [Bacilli bacterium]|nr:nitroreductase family protein [Bacilli bacterium]